MANRKWKSNTVWTKTNKWNNLPSVLSDIQWGATERFTIKIICTLQFFFYILRKGQKNPIWLLILKSFIIGQHLHDATRPPAKVFEVPLHQLRGLRGLYRTENLPQARGRNKHNFSDLSDSVPSSVEKARKVAIGW